jgi:hypothetical protein
MVLNWIDKEKIIMDEIIEIEKSNRYDGLKKN